MINRVVLVGRLTRDVEVRKTTNGLSVASFTVACDRRQRRDAQNQQSADFISCVAWDQTADFMSNFLTKGSLISVEGRIQSGSYEDTTGKKVYTQDVVADRVQALESRAQRQEQSSRPTDYAPAYQEAPTPSASYESNDEPILDITSDDLPF